MSKARRILGFVLMIVLAVTAVSALAGWNDPYATIVSVGTSRPDHGMYIPENYFGKVLRVHDQVGGWFRLIAPSSAIRFTVLSPELPYGSFSIRVYLKEGSGEWSEIEQLSFSESSAKQKRVLKNIRKGDMIAFWNDDGSGRDRTLQQDYLLRMDIVSSASKPEVATGKARDILQGSARVSFTVSGNGGAKVTDSGIQYGYSKSKTKKKSYGSLGSETGSFSLKLTGLKSNRKVYYRAYAKNSRGTSYGSWKTFKTLKVTKPTVATLKAGSVTASSAKFGINLKENGGAAVTDCGILWGYSADGLTHTGSFGEKGQETGKFRKTVKKLKSGATVYYRAYAKNEKGRALGDVLSVTLKTDVASGDSLPGPGGSALTMNE